MTASLDKSAFSSSVIQALGAQALVNSSRGRLSLHISQTRGNVMLALNNAKRVVENCSSRSRICENACVYIGNIAALLDVAEIEYPQEPGGATR
jgi:hypothetical protein